MDLQELYEELEGSYPVVLDRVMRDSTIISLMEAFLEDQEFSKLAHAMDVHQYEDAFEAAHALKGVALNMELGLLAKSVLPLTEALRHGYTPEADELFTRVKAGYEQTTRIIREALGA